VKRTTALASLVALMFSTCGVVPAATTSTNANTWSGYVDKGATFTYVSANWTQPTVSCPVQSARVSFWIGLDGFGNGTVEQAGTFVKCSLNAPVTYLAFWEMFDGPHSPGGEPFAVSPGDKIFASVRYARGAFVLEVRDKTNHKHLKVTEQCAKVCQRSIAEWIVERPGNGTYPLANYSKVEFKAAKADGVPGGSGGISAFPDILQVTMQHAGKKLSTPSNLGSHDGGKAFDCIWLASQ
jgi:Peptidase A4 family